MPGLPSYEEIMSSGQTPSMALPSYEDVIKNAQPSGAKAAFEAGSPNARMIKDTGEVIYPNPVSTSASFASGALRGATSIPFLGNQAAKGISAVTGQTPEDYASFEQAAKEQHPIAEAVGELAGIFGPGAKLWQMGGEALVQGSKLAARGIQEAATAAEGVVLKGATKLSNVIGSPGIKKIVAILNDAAAAGNPRVLRQSIQTMEDGAEKVGASLSSDYKTVEKTLPPESHYTAQELKDALKQNILNDAASKNEALTKDFSSDLESEIDNVVGNRNPEDLVKTDSMWKMAQKTKARAGGYKIGKIVPKNENTPDVLNRVNQSLRNLLSDQVSEAAQMSNNPNLIDSVQKQSELYGQIKDGVTLQKAKLITASKPERIQQAADRAAEVLALGPSKLGKYYGILTKQLPRGLAAAGAIHANLLANDPKYRDLLDKFNQESTQPQ